MRVKCSRCIRSKLMSDVMLKVRRGVLRASRGGIIGADRLPAEDFLSAVSSAKVESQAGKPFIKTDAPRGASRNRAIVCPKGKVVSMAASGYGKYYGRSNEMLMKKFLRVMAVVLLINTGLLWARTLSTRFTDVILSGLKPGGVYSLKQIKKLPYKVVNESDKPTDVEVLVEKPSASQIRGDYEPIPDVSWIRITPSAFHLLPGESTDCDIIFSIPDDQKLMNRHFQAMAVTQNAPDPNAKGVAIRFALASRLRFSLGDSPEEVMDIYRKNVLDVLDIELSPSSLVLSQLSSGKKVQLDNDSFPTLQLINKGKENYQIEFALADNPNRYGLTRDYEPMPKEIKVKFKRKKLKVKPRSIQDIVMSIEIPDDDELRGKSYAFVVVGNVLGFDIPIELFGRVYFRTEEKK